MPQNVTLQTYVCFKLFREISERNAFASKDCCIEDVDDRNSDCFVEACVLASGLQSSAPVAEAYDALQRDILTQRYGLCVRHLAVSRQPLPIPLPFPLIFSVPTLMPGAVLSGCQKPENVGPDVVAAPVLTRLATGPQLLPLLRHKISVMKSLGGRRGAPGAAILADWGFAREDTEEMVEQLQRLVQGGLGSFEEDTE